MNHDTIQLILPYLCTRDILRVGATGRKPRVWVQRYFERFYNEFSKYFPEMPRAMAPVIHAEARGEMVMKPQPLTGKTVKNAVDRIHALCAERRYGEPEFTSEWCAKQCLTGQLYRSVIKQRTKHRENLYAFQLMFWHQAPMVRAVNPHSKIWWNLVQNPDDWFSRYYVCEAADLREFAVRLWPDINLKTLEQFTQYLVLSFRLHSFDLLEAKRQIREASDFFARLNL